LWCPREAIAIDTIQLFIGWVNVCKIISRGKCDFKLSHPYVSEGFENLGNKLINPAVNHLLPHRILNDRVSPMEEAPGIKHDQRARHLHFNHL